MENWKFAWNEKTREVMLESPNQYIIIKADEAMKFINELELECTTVKHFKHYVIYSLKLFPKECYKLVNKK